MDPALIRSLLGPKPEEKPFKSTLRTAMGEIVVRILPGRQAELKLPMKTVHVAKEPVPVPLECAGVFVIVKARVARADEGWRFESFDAIMHSGLGKRVCDENLSRQVETALLEVVSAHLDDNAKLLVEADLDEVAKRREVLDKKVTQLEWEISRRKDKLKGAKRERDTAEAGFSERETALRAELEALESGPRFG